MTIAKVNGISSFILQANMIVLSARYTARGDSEGVLDLARAFLIARAKSVVTALWGVSVRLRLTKTN